jgi:ABC-type branched-subunit amino acid transport system substrate-binding protein
VVNAYTGGLAPYAPPFEQAIRLAVSRVNEVGIAGRQIELLFRDSRTQPETARAQAEDLILNAGIAGLIGPPASGEVLAASEVIVANRMVHINGSSTAANISDLADDGYMFRTVQSDSLQGVALARSIYDAGMRRLGILYIGNAYGKGLEQITATAFAAAGGMVVASEEFPDSAADNYDYKPHMSTVFAQTPDAVALIAYAASGTRILNEWVTDKSAFGGRWYLTDGMQSTDIAANVGTMHLAGIEGTAPSAQQSAQIDAFTTAYQERYSDLPGIYATNYYDATMLLCLALARALQSSGDVASDDVRDALYEVSRGPGVVFAHDQVRPALDAVAAGMDIDYDGVSGPVDFDAKGDVTGKIDLWKYTNTGQVEITATLDP